MFLFRIATLFQRTILGIGIRMRGEYGAESLIHNAALGVLADDAKIVVLHRISIVVDSVWAMH